MDFKNIICVTNRHLLSPSIPLGKEAPDEENNMANASARLLERIARLAGTDADGILLREKDMSMEDYTKFAKAAADICSKKNKLLILHTFIETAIRLGHPHIHLPLPVLKEVSDKDGLSIGSHTFTTVGVSVHSVQEALSAERLGATYLIAGHIFETDCKKGVPPRGMEFLRAITSAVHIPVYAIGGISAENLPAVLSCGAAGGCMMSGAMRAEE